MRRAAARIIQWSAGNAMALNEIITSITLGLLATGSPCVLPLYPGYLVYIGSGQRQLAGKTGSYFLGFFVLAGVLSMMLALGGMIAWLSVSVGKALAIIVPLADLIIIGLGVLLVLNVNPFKTLPQVQIPVLSHPFANAYIYGLLYGPLTLPCSGPLVISIFALSFTTAEVLSKLSLFFWFGVGFGVPLLVLSLISGGAQRWIVRQFAIHARRINLVSGLLLVGVGVVDLISNWRSLMIFL